MLLLSLGLLVECSVDAFAAVRTAETAKQQQQQQQQQERLAVAVTQGPNRVRRHNCVRTNSKAILTTPSRRQLVSLRGGGASNTDTTPPLLDKLRSFTSKNFFLLGMLVAVGLARAFPALGKNGGILRPELLIGNYGVTLIFLLSGLSLQMSELKQAASSFKLNLLIQGMSFVAWPFLLGLPLKRAAASLLPPALLDGILILTCLPTTVNMCVILTGAARGNVASALCNAVMSNLGGIFATPALLFRFFGSDIQLPFMNMLLKLSNKVLLPVVIGQMLRATPAKDFYATHSNFFKRTQEVILLSILWNAFCTAISSKMGLDLRHGLVLCLLLTVVHLISLVGLFALFSRPLFKFSHGEVVAGMFCASHKTLAFGLPLVNTIFEGSSNLAAYCAPIMFIHPIQLIIGTLLIPKLERYTVNDVAE